MRTVSEIKESIAADFMRNENVAEKYGFNVGDNFSAHFSSVSLESILFHIFAYASWVLETMFYSHKQEVEDRIEEIIPHRPKWYRDKMLNFMKDKTLIPDTDDYDTAGMSDEAIEQAKVIKHAVAVENNDASILTIKVAGENNGIRQRLPDETEKQVRAYIAEIKDAGVRVDLVNKDPDTFNCEVDIYYNAMLLPEHVEASCRAAIVSYVENLPFNGVYTNMELIDSLQAVDGVKIAELKKSTTLPSGLTTVSSIDALVTPEAGYFAVGNSTVINMIVYEQ